MLLLFLLLLVMVGAVCPAAVQITDVPHAPFPSSKLQVSGWQHHSRQHTHIHSLSSRHDNDWHALFICAQLW